MRAETTPCLIGITGGIACGKSEVGRLLAARGLAVCETDKVAHELIQPEGAAYQRVVQHFGRDIVMEDGTINRRVLGKMVFGDSRARAELNRIIHPLVRRRWLDWAADQRARCVPAAVIIPLLFEVGAEREVDAVICVSASDKVIRSRLAQRGYAPDEIEQRLVAQWPLAEKRRRADYIIENTGSLDALQQQTNVCLQWILKKEKK